MCELAFESPPDPLFRLARRPDPWTWPDWSYAEPGGTFGNRYDDPDGRYRVLYAATERLATFVETLAPFRPDPEVEVGLAEIEGEDDTPGPGAVPRSWVGARLVGCARVSGAFAAVGEARSLAYLRVAMASRLLHFAVSDLDAAVIRLHAPRRLTQEISRLVFECSSEERRNFAGIAYQSRFGDDFHNWAIFEPADVSPGPAEEFGERDPDLQAALELHGLRLYDD